MASAEKAKSLDLLVSPGSGFGCPGVARVAYCVPTEQIRRSLPVFRKLAELYKK